MANLIKFSQKARMSELVETLNKASEAYYNNLEIMSNYEYDALLDELKSLEQSSGIVLPNSPTHSVGYRPTSEKLKKVKYKFPAKSLDKTKNIDEFVKLFGVNGDDSDTVILMWKLDGCTLQLEYNDGKLQSAVTRGDGEVGQDVTYNAIRILGIPMNVWDTSNFTVRGEVVMSYNQFNKINENLVEDKQFKNPRNLASSTLTMLDPDEVERRELHFKLFELVDHPKLSQWDFYQRVVKFGESQGFEVVPALVCQVNSQSGFDSFKAGIKSFDPSLYNFPVDGLVAAYNDTSYTDLLPGTDHHPNPLKGYALKWADTTAKTIVRKIEWSPSRTGLLNPVAIFDPVQLEGTSVSRASLHNLSIMKKLDIRVGDEIEVFKANKIIPQISKNLSDKGDYSDSEIYDLIGCCPECGTRGEIRKSADGIETVYCPNANCRAKLVSKLTHFCDRTAMNIEGLSEATLRKFVDLGYINSFEDIYTLDRYKDQIIELDGFGEKSWANLWDSINLSKFTTLVKFLVGVGIPGIGNSQAKAISDYFNGNINEFLCSKYLDFSVISGIGPTVNASILTWLHNDEIQESITALLTHLNFQESISGEGTLLKDMVFVITGSLNQHKNRKELESEIVANGGSVSSSVTSKTDFLINNDITSNSSKNRKAKELGVKIISEDDFIKMLL